MGRIILNNFPICSNHCKCKQEKIANGSGWFLCPKYFFLFFFLGLTLILTPNLYIVGKLHPQHEVYGVPVLSWPERAGPVRRVLSALGHLIRTFHPLEDMLSHKMPFLFSNVNYLFHEKC